MDRDQLTYIDDVAQLQEGLDGISDITHSGVVKVRTKWGKHTDRRVLPGCKTPETLPLHWDLPLHCHHLLQLQQSRRLLHSEVFYLQKLTLPAYLVQDASTWAMMPVQSVVYTLACIASSTLLSVALSRRELCHNEHIETPCCQAPHDSTLLVKQRVTL